MTERRSRPRRIIVIGALAAALVLSSQTVPAQAEDAQRLTSFETADEVAAITSGRPDNDHFRQSTDGAVDGDHALHLEAAADTSPQLISYTLPAGDTFRRTDWSSYRILAGDVVNASDHPVTVAVTIKDETGDEATAGFRVGAFSYGTTNFSMAYLTNRSVDPARVASIRYEFTRSTTGSVDLYVDALRVQDEHPYDTASRIRKVLPLLKTRMIERLAQLDAERADAAARIPHRDQQQFPAVAALLADDEAVRDAIASARAAAEAVGTPEDLAEAARSSQSLVDRVQRFVARIEAFPANPTAPFGLLTADSADLVYPNDRPCRCTAGPRRLDVARGETESTQVVVAALAGDLHDVTASVTKVLGPDGEPVPAATIGATVSPLGLLKVTPSSAYSGAYTYAGWMPDPIRIDLDTADLIKDRTFQPFWTDVTTTARTKPGTYRMTVTVRAGRHQVNQQIDVRVSPAKIAERNVMPTAFTTHPDHFAQATYGLTETEDIRAMVHRSYDLLEQYRIEPDNIYAGYLGGNYAGHPAYGPDVDDLLYLERQGRLRQFNAFYVDPRTFDPDPDTWDAQVEQLIKDLKASMDVYTAAGLRDKAYFYGFDESTAPYRPLIKKITTAMKQEFPDIPIMSTLRDTTFGPGSGLTGLIDIWVPTSQGYNAERADTARARGDQVYWYIAIGPAAPYPNWFNGYPPMDARLLMGVMSRTQRVDGFLYYNIDRWQDKTTLGTRMYSPWNPATYGPTAGDGSLWYPGPDGPVPSQRMANVRDGLEDANLMAALAESLEDANPEQRERAETLLTAASLTLSASQHTEDSTRLRTWRHDVLRLIADLS